MSNISNCSSFNTRSVEYFLKNLFLFSKPYNIQHSFNESYQHKYSVHSAVFTLKYVGQFIFTNTTKSVTVCYSIKGNNSSTVLAIYIMQL